jgi:predicted restriction endonuclease
MLKSCGYCHRIHDSKYICSEKEKAIKKRHGKKVYKSKFDVFEETNVDGFRNTKAWRIKREEIRQRDNNLCQICFRELYQTMKRLTYDGLSVHHCEPLNENYEKRLDDDNLLCLCEYHHRLCDNGTIPQEEVKQIIQEQERKRMI